MIGLRTFLRVRNAKRKLGRCDASALGAYAAWHAVSVGMPHHHWTDVSPSFWWNMYLVLLRGKKRGPLAVWLLLDQDNRKPLL